MGSYAFDYLTRLSLLHWTDALPAMKLTRCYILGRFINPETGRAVNIHKGVRASRGDSWFFYLYRGKRHFITEGDLRKNWNKEPFKL